MLGLLGKNDFEERKVDLDAPISLPDSLIDRFGLLDKEKRVETTGGGDARMIPSDLVRERVLLDKLEGSSSVELLGGRDSSKQDVPSKDVESLGVSKVEPLSVSGGEDSGERVDVKKSERPSFFEDLEKRLGDKRAEVDRQLSFDLLDMMKRFHVARSRGEHFFFHEQELEDVLYKKLLHLKELEEEWVIRAREVNVARDLLSEKEVEIERVSNDLKSLLRKADRFKLFNRVVSHDVAFRLVSGKLLLSLNDLLHELQVMDEEVFRHHVFSGKNDFADWVLHVFHDGKLASLIRSCEDRSSLIKLLNEY